MTSAQKAVRALHELSETANDFRFGIRTAGHIRAAEAGTGDPDANDYAATPYRVFRRIFRRLPAACFKGSLIDYGCGRGRVPVLAASLPFRRVIGIELSEALHREALKNVARARVPRRAKVEILRVDATKFSVPDDVTAAYFYNPFGRSTTEKVLERIVESLRRRPREFWLLAYNPRVLEQEFEGKLQTTVLHRGRTVYPSARWVIVQAELPV